MTAGFSACNNADKTAAGMNELEGASAGDSMMYYLGQMRALEYWQQAEKDTTLQGEKARQDFMRGVRAGLGATGESDAYDLGVYQGIQLAINFKNFEKDYATGRLHTDIMLRAMTVGMENDSAVNVNEARKELYNIMGRFEKEKADRDSKESLSGLASAVSKLGMKKISDRLYGKEIKAGNGTKFTPGEKLTVHIIVKDAAGKVLRVPMPREIVVGARYVSEVVSEALATMTMDGVSEFATSAYVMLGDRCSRLGLKPDQVLLMTIQTGASATFDEQPAAPAAAGRPV